MQKAWALVVRGNWASPSTVRSTRTDVIKHMLDVYKSLHQHRYPNLTTAQFWCMMKRRYGWAVRKIEIKVLW
jgi:hypothetical protein